ncbi:hypothetical protein CEH05_07005 [Halobacillus halophilus]|nr:hypothetical protein [Halobacillus halophilus]ASF38875.1 hypothetical protein CEH05_07005 [Halobacillus halophilus]
MFETAEFTVSLIAMAATTTAATAALISAIAANKNIEIAKGQLEEIANQRRDAVRPDLYIRECESKFKYNKDLGYARTEVDQLLLYIENIGIGPAKMAEFKWIININKSLRAIEPFNKDNLFYRIENNQLMFNEAGVISYSEDFSTQTIPLFPADEKKGVRFPFTYTRLLGITIQLIQEGKIKREEVPEILLEVSYNNIFNEKIIKKVYVINTEVVTQSLSTADNLISGYDVLIFKRAVERPSI